MAHEEEGINRMSTAADEFHAPMSKQVTFTVWFCLLGLTAVEVFLAYEQLELKVMLVLLMTLSIVKASLIIAYFMHLRYERQSLVWSLMPALIFVVGMLFVMFPDSVRVLLMKPK